MEDAVLDVFSRLGSLGRPLRRACGWLGKKTEIEGTAGAKAGVGVCHGGAEVAGAGRAALKGARGGSRR